ncbi:MAG: hypothetical protein F9K19_17995 [Rhizobiaceae bacterium]|nr:MAG: hypothetical protein F9K19_17995 [Rhizobiaceae bacterium]CAG0963595.1 hypothetical protein RHIZO_00834 [Rhizobiaceae bacterium]
MKLRLLGAAAVALSLFSVPALAQQAPVTSPNVDQPAASDSTDTGTTGSIGGNWTSDSEKSMYEENREMWSNFFTDDSMSTVKEEAELRAAFSGMGADDQAQIKAACERVDQDRGSYGTITQGLCTQIGQM